MKSGAVRIFFYYLVVILFLYVWSVGKQEKKIKLNIDVYKNVGTYLHQDFILTVSSFVILNNIITGII